MHHFSRRESFYVERQSANGIECDEMKRQETTTSECHVENCSEFDEKPNHRFLPFIIVRIVSNRRDQNQIECLILRKFSIAVAPPEPPRNIINFVGVQFDSSGFSLTKFMFRGSSEKRGIWNIRLWQDNFNKLRTPEATEKCLVWKIVVAGSCPLCLRFSLRRVDDIFLQKMCSQKFFDTEKSGAIHLNMD